MNIIYIYMNIKQNKLELLPMMFIYILESVVVSG